MSEQTVEWLPKGMTLEESKEYFESLTFRDDPDKTADSIMMFVFTLVKNKIDENRYKME